MKEIKTELKIYRTFEYDKDKMEEQIEHMADMIRKGYSIEDFSWGKVRYFILEG